MRAFEIDGNRYNEEWFKSVSKSHALKVLKGKRSQKVIVRAWNKANNVKTVNKNRKNK